MHSHTQPWTTALLLSTSRLLSFAFDRHRANKEGMPSLFLIFSTNPDVLLNNKRIHAGLYWAWPCTQPTGSRYPQKNQDDPQWQGVPPQKTDIQRSPQMNATEWGPRVPGTHLQQELGRPIKIKVEHTTSKQRKSPECTYARMHTRPLLGTFLRLTGHLSIC